MKVLHLEKGDNKLILQDILKIVRQGGLAVSPSDTVYGLVADAGNEKAIAKLIRFKNRPIGKSISVFVSDLQMAKKYVRITEKQEQLLKSLLPGPFTVVLPSRHKTSKYLEAENGTLGIRIPDYAFIRQLVAGLGRPLTATSANLGGRPPHYSVESLLGQLPAGKKAILDLVIDGGKLPRNKPSTVIDLAHSQLRIIRKGDIIFKQEQVFTTRSAKQTAKTAGFIVNQLLRDSHGKPLVIILKGELGAGKTAFIKGIGSFFNIKDIISPTFTVYYEYPVKNRPGINKLFHYDLYNIEDPDELRYIGLEENIKKGNLICIEWGEKAGDILSIIKEKSNLVYVEIKYVNEKVREIALQR